jgi:hypothetical protein
MAFCAGERQSKGKSDEKATDPRYDDREAGGDDVQEYATKHVHWSLPGGISRVKQEDYEAARVPQERDAARTLKRPERLVAHNSRIVSFRPGLHYPALCSPTNLPRPGQATGYGPPDIIGDSTG